MKENLLVCKIYFYDTDSNTAKKIVGMIDKNQLFSPLNNFIEVKNYKNKTISKNDVEKIFVYEKQTELVITKKSLEVNTPLKITG